VGVYIDHNTNEIGVLHRGNQVVMGLIPPMFPASSNAETTASVLSGDYNLIFYGVDIKGTNSLGFPIPELFSERGTGTFEPNALPWPSFTFQIDKQNRRQILKADCETGENIIGVPRKGIYGVNLDGSFYLFNEETRGSLRGTFTPDGSIFIGSMYDSSSRLMLIYGVRSTGSIVPHLTSDGTVDGRKADYVYTNYRNDNFSFLPPHGNYNLRHFLGIGRLEADAEEFISAAGDINVVFIQNMMGEAGEPLTPGPGSQEAAQTFVIRFQKYFSQAGGMMEKVSGADNLAGSITSDGGTLILMRDHIEKDDNGCPTDFGYGIGFRQGLVGSFEPGDFNGAFSLTGFGDHFDEVKRISNHRSTAATIIFDGLGNAEIIWLENTSGILSYDRLSLSYEINPRVIPTNPDMELTVDAVDFFIRSSGVPFASALMSESGKMLIFFRSLKPDDNANMTRLLGLAILQ